ncbi:putative tricarboxylate transport protein, mitochondrial [Lycorma delicatula]|uniref:putative tricarboxylate transport protein, mitochondrial n=1 Tax=Lycorma delicatula TaxID=130591 RepID=UPI003F5114B0
MVDKEKNTVSNNSVNRPWMYNNLAAVGESGGTFKGILAGGIAGGAEILVSYPTEYIKTQLQLDEQPGKNKRYNGFMDVIKKTVKERGVFGLYRGVNIFLFFSVPKGAVRFGSFETLKSWTADERGNLNAKMRALCGLVAGVNEAIFVVTPMETMKVKYINDQRLEKPRYRGLIHSIATILKEDGFKGIYQGVTATILKEGSNQAIRFYLFETLKNKYRDGDPTVHVPKVLVSLFGIIAGVTSVFANNPVDVIKTRMQGLEASKYSSTWNCVQTVWKNEGLLAFYKGTTARLLRVTIELGFIFVAYDSVMDILTKILP